VPIRSDADLSLRGQARLLAEYLDRLELNDVTLVFNAWCGAQVMVAEAWDARIGRLVFASCETFDNYPPGLPGRRRSAGLGCSGSHVPSQVVSGTVSSCSRIAALPRAVPPYGSDGASQISPSSCKQAKRPSRSRSSKARKDSSTTSEPSSWMGRDYRGTIL
jgi:hypothetical protein